jgi:hypothetical protein
LKIACMAALLLAVCATVSAQQNSTEHKPLSVWNIHTRDVSTVQPGQAPIAVMTPAEPIMVRRVEAITMRGPIDLTVRTLEPKPCPLTFNLEITNGLVKQLIPISNQFIKKDSQQTYTDSGPMNLMFEAGNRVTVTLIVPNAGFPPTSCPINGMNISIQFEPVDSAVGKTE